MTMRSPGANTIRQRNFFLLRQNDFLSSIRLGEHCSAVCMARLPGHMAGGEARRSVAATLLLLLTCSVGGSLGVGLAGSRLRSSVDVIRRRGVAPGRGLPGTRVMPLGQRLRGGLEGDAGDEDGGLGTAARAEAGEPNLDLEGGFPSAPSTSGKVVTVTEHFYFHECPSLASYLPHLQQYQNPLVTRAWPINTNFVGLNETVTDTVFCNSLRAQSKGITYSQWVRAGPRKQTFFTPSEVNAAVVSAGGLDPGINIVVREIVFTLELAYNVKRAWGVRYGWRGFFDDAAKEWLELTQARVQHIHKEGGSILGYSAETCEGEKVGKIVDVLEERGINMLFILGNVDTCKTASAVQSEAMQRKMKLSVIMIPKSIENNFPYIDKCIGFDTVVQGAVDAIHRTLLAASSVQGGIGIIKLGSGFMCLTAVMASGDADVCLLKHINFSPQLVFQYIEKVEPCPALPPPTPTCFDADTGESFPDIYSRATGGA